MKILCGQYNTATVFTDQIEDTAKQQIVELCDQKFAAGSKIRIMPDVHAGAGCTIGTTMTITDKIVPNLVGVDIGCGMECARLHDTELDMAKLDEAIHRLIPSGFSIRNEAHANTDALRIDELYCPVNVDRARKSLGTLGGGNHFIEANRDDEGNLYIVIHSGSRHMGLEIANYYQNLAWERLRKPSGADIAATAAIISRLKAEEREREIERAIKHEKARTCTNVPKALAYLEGRDMEDYLHDMAIAQEYAAINRKTMLEIIVTELGLAVAEQYTTIHNYIDLDTMILRKGAVSAKAGEKLIIPINMRDGSLVCIGKGNNDWNQSAPHGAGRLMSRAAARKAFTVEEFRGQMDNVYTTSVGADTLDECPMAYKGMNDIVKNIGETVDIVATIKPVFNFKAGG